MFLGTKKHIKISNTLNTFNVNQAIQITAEAVNADASASSVEQVCTQKYD
jgi:hypothetical protein